MNKQMQYRNLDHALKYFRVQVSQGILWAIENTPPMNSPREIFDYLKARTKYKKDPRGMELFQGISTLLTENNWHGITGAGDCDCFSIAALSTLLANKFTDVGIVLAGRSPLYPVHIWVYVNDQGKYYDFDLTCKKFNETRHYPYKQLIPYKLNQEEKKMLLQLAECGMSAGAKRYIKFERTGHLVPETYYDNLGAGAFQRKMLSEGIDISEIEQLSARRAERKAAKPTRMEKKAERYEVRAQKPKNVRKSEKVSGKAEKRKSSGQARVERAMNPNRESFGTQFQKVAGSAAQVIQATRQPDADEQATDFVNQQNYQQPEYEYEQETIEVPDEMILQPEDQMSEGDPYLVHKIIFGTLVGGAVVGVAAASLRR